jgi:intron-binding protein aquarius
MFEEVGECRGFELIRNNKERGNYLISKLSKIIAMTSTHAALKRKDLIESGFEFDNIIVEEAGQLLEIDSFIPLTLHSAKSKNQSKVKRIILIGDQNQLPPIIKNNAYQKYSNMEQSMFTRLIRLGIPYVCLNMQGRCRASLLELFNWRYPNLQCLPEILEDKAFKVANPAFKHVYQFINVPDFDSKGEVTPMPHFYQNLAEAEFVIATYMFMILKGYPANKITILTTYNGQKFLIRDIFRQKCSWNPIFKKPKITTVDKYQGQQNDYILLSLVRTNALGHFRDPRRLTVAFSRAKLGFYIFGRYDLFSQCNDVIKSFQPFKDIPKKLEIFEDEQFPTERLVGSDKKVKSRQIEDFQEMYKLVQVLLEKQM